MISITEKYCFFYRDCPLSQYWKCRFTDEKGVRFTSAEQYMHYKKAELFGDRENAAIILTNHSPLFCKRMGRRVRGFDERVWEKESVKIVSKGTRLKFEQNVELMTMLRKTGTRKIVEANPSDAIWGIGMAIGDPGIEDETNWRGQNRLGEILTKFRDGMKEKINE